MDAPFTPPTPEDAFATMRAVVAEEATEPLLVELRQVPGRGRGVVALRDIPKGSVVMVGPCFQFLSDHPAPNQFHLSTLAAAAHDVLGDAVFALQPWDNAATDPALLKRSADMLTPQARRIGDALRLNGFSSPAVAVKTHTKGTRPVTGISVYEMLSTPGINVVPGYENGFYLPLGASMINHECSRPASADGPAHPSTTIWNLGVCGKEENQHRAAVIALRDIAAGEELSVTYGDCSVLDEHYGIRCECGAKTEEHAIDDKLTVNAEIQKNMKRLGLSNIVHGVDTCLITTHPGTVATHVARCHAKWGPAPPTLAPGGHVLAAVGMWHTAERPVRETALFLIDVVTRASSWAAATIRCDARSPDAKTIVAACITAARIALSALPIHMYVNHAVGARGPAAAKAALAALRGDAAFVDAPVPADAARATFSDFPAQDWEDTVLDAAKVMGAALASLVRLPEDTVMLILRRVDANAFRPHPGPAPDAAGVEEAKKADD